MRRSPAKYSSPKICWAAASLACPSST